MLSTREAVRIGRRGGRTRTRNLSPELRTELATWAELVRSQRQRGEVTAAEQRRRLIHLLHSEDPGLATLLRFLPRLPLRLAYQVYESLPAEQLALVEAKVAEVLCGL